MRLSDSCVLVVPYACHEGLSARKPDGRRSPQTAECSEDRFDFTPHVWETAPPFFASLLLNLSSLPHSTNCGNGRERRWRVTRGGSTQLNSGRRCKRPRQRRLVGWWTENWVAPACSMGHTLDSEDSIAVPVLVSTVHSPQSSVRYPLLSTSIPNTKVEAGGTMATPGRLQMGGRSEQMARTRGASEIIVMPGAEGRWSLKRNSARAKERGRFVIRAEPWNPTLVLSIPVPCRQAAEWQGRCRVYTAYF